MFPGIEENIHYCIADGRTVFLDLTADRYFCAPTSVDQAFQAWVAASGKPHLPDDALKALSDAGVIVDTNKWGMKPPCAAVPAAQSAVDGTNAGIKIGTAIDIIAAQLICRLQLKYQRVSRVINSLVVEKQNTPRSSAGEQLATCAHEFSSAALILGTRDRCLSRSVAMVRYLLRQGHDANLVIGVRMMPFRAHAWVQSADVVLSDTLDNVIPYTPILIV